MTNQVNDTKKVENTEKVVSPNNDTNPVQEKVNTVQPEVKKEDQQEDPNWRAFREARKQDRAQREIAEKEAHKSKAEAEALKAAMEALLNKPQPQVNPYTQQYEQQEETEDQRIEKKINEALIKQKAAYDTERMDRERQEYPQRLKQTFPDFTQVVSQENLDYLEYHFPEVARPLQRAEDNYEKWVDIYKAVQRFVPNNANSKKDIARAEKNSMMPKSISSTNVTPKGESAPIRLTEDRRKANWERMQRSMKGLT